MDKLFSVEINKEEKRVRITCLTKDRIWHNVKVTFNKKWYDEPIVYFTFKYPDVYHYHEITNFDTSGHGFILFQSMEDENSFYKHNIIDYKKIDERKEDFNPCILVSSFPNTREKENFLIKNLNSLKKTGIPVFLCSNMLIKEEIVSKADHYIYTGPNQMYSILDFYDLKTAVKKVVTDFKPLKVIETGNSGSSILFHDLNHQIYSKKNYYWAAINSSKKAFQVLKSWGYTHVMKTEGEFVLDKKDLEIPIRKLKEINDKKVQAEYFIRTENFHIEAFLYFADVRFLSDVYSNFTVDDFFTSGSTPENYVKYRVFFSGIYNKINVFVDKEYAEFTKRRSWVTENVEVLEVEKNVGSIENFLPNSKEIRYSNNLEVSHQVPAIDNFEIEVLPKEKSMKKWSVTVRNFASGLNPEKMEARVSFLDKDRNEIDSIHLSLNTRQFFLLNEKIIDKECRFVEYTAEYTSKIKGSERNSTIRILDFDQFFETNV